MTPAVTEAAVAAAAAAACAASLLAAARARAAARADRLALRLARAREVAFVEAARRLSDAARGSIEGVRAEMDRAVRAVAPAVDAVMFFEERDGALACVAAFGSRVAYFAGMRLALDDRDVLVGRALARGHRALLATEPGARPLHPGDGCAAAVPLVLEAGRSCVLYAGAAAGLDAPAVDRIVALVDQATPAYRIALERAEDRTRAEYDGLTGLLTPRAFRARLAELVERARYARMGRVALLFVDTDRFKTWNDTYGHASGDALLRALAAELRASAADGDLVARNGGDEFCVVFDGTEKSRAIERADALRRRIAALDVAALAPDGAQTRVRISASIGIACFPADAATPHELLERADAAMYHSKRTGRDGVSFVGAGGAPVRAEETASPVG